LHARAGRAHIHTHFLYPCTSFQNIRSGRAAVGGHILFPVLLFPSIFYRCPPVHAGDFTTLRDPMARITGPLGRSVGTNQVFLCFFCVFFSHALPFPKGVFAL
jgi:hypothetical protein